MIKYSHKSCMICQSNNKVFLEYVNSSEIKNYFYVICKTCGMMFLDKSFSDKKLEIEYNDCYWEDAENIDMLSRMYARGIGIINNIKSYGHKPCNILDVGGGIGGVALGMRSPSRSITIIDRSKRARNQAKSFGFRVYKTIEDIQDKLYEFDTIVMCHSLEHFMDPLGFIESIKKLLKPNTLIYMGV